MKKQLQIFFDFLRFCIGSADEIPSSLKEADWKELYAIAQKQCLVGVLFDGIKKLPAEHVGMEKELLLQWMAESQMLEKSNVRLNDAAIQVSEWFRKKGFRTCILKGQGNALMYPNPYSRTPGDIDIWVEGGDKELKSIEPILNLNKIKQYNLKNTGISVNDKWKLVKFSTEFDLALGEQANWITNGEFFDDDELIIEKQKGEDAGRIVGGTIVGVAAGEETIKISGGSNSQIIHVKVKGIQPDQEVGKKSDSTIKDSDKYTVLNSNGELWQVYPETKKVGKNVKRYVGGGSMQITLFVKGKVVTTQHLLIGIMRVQEKLFDLGMQSGNYEQQIQEVVDKELEVFKALYLPKDGIRYVIFMGDYISAFMPKISKENGKRMVDADKFYRYTEKLRAKNTGQIARELGITNESDTLLIPALVIYRQLVTTLNAQNVVVPVCRCHIGYASVFSLGFSDVAVPFVVEQVVVEDKRFSQTAPCPVAEPRLPLVALRTVNGHSLVVGEYSPFRIVVNLVENGV